jgi:cytochrome P450
MGILVETSLSVQVGLALVVILAYPTFQIIYNVVFHPLAKIPGPKLWAASRIPFVYNLLRGTLVKRQREFHDYYGSVFRMAPDEVSFASEEAWEDIYAWRSGHKRAIRDPNFFSPPEGQADNLITTSNVKFHARVRGLMSNSFTEEALREQAPLIEGHADTLINQLLSRAITSQNLAEGALVNMTDWINFFTMDVVSASRLPCLKFRG